MGAVRVERRLAAILAADAVGYSKLVERDEASALDAIKAEFNSCIVPSIEEHHGRVVKTMGDGCIAEFASVVEAVKCAIDVQLRLSERHSALPDAPHLPFRIGINLGDVMVEGDDLLGDGINVAARLEQLAKPGGVLLSETVHEQLRGRLHARMEFAGELHLKNIERPVRAYRLQPDGDLSAPPPARPANPRWVGSALASLVLALAAAAAFYLWPQGNAGLAGRASLAVLPFANIAGDEASARLADGLTEDIITDLSRYRTMDVIAHNSIEKYNGQAVRPRDVGRELGVRYVLEGSVQRDADQIRVTAQLIDATTDAHLWSERWDQPAKEFFAIQTDIADQIGNRLAGAGVIDKAEQEAARRSRPGSLSAYDLYLAARSEALRSTEDGNRKAAALYEKAVAADPLLARAWADLAGVRQTAVNYGADPGVALPAALSAARRAVDIDPGDASAHAMLARVLGMQGHLGPSEAEFETALRLNPGDAEILALYASWATSFGHPERAAEAADRAIRLNPGYQIWQAYDFSYAYFSAGRYKDALKVLDRLPRDRYIFYSWVLRATSLAALGRSEEAKAAVADTMALFPDLTIEGFTGTPDWSDPERRHLVETMRAAGFPVCAKAEKVAQNPDLIRLKECLSQ
jgi:TolB-like protein/class 3 adenylate cyclase/cytochrome c-type biogenesis protein CcmH/NrfG